jgi:hypothetical protein
MRSVLQRQTKRKSNKAVPTLKNSKTKQCGELVTTASSCSRFATGHKATSSHRRGGQMGPRVCESSPCWELKYNHRKFWIRITALRHIIGCSVWISAGPSAILRFFVVFLSTSRICQAAPQQKMTASFKAL